MSLNQEVLNRGEGALFWHEFKIKASLPNTIQPEDKQSQIKQTLLTFNQTQAQALVISNPMLDDLSVWELLKQPKAPYQLHLIQWGDVLPNYTLAMKLVDALGLECQATQVESFSIQEDLKRGEEACFYQTLVQLLIDEGVCLHSEHDYPLINKPFQITLAEYYDLFSRLPLQIDTFSRKESGEEGSSLSGDYLKVVVSETGDTYCFCRLTELCPWDHDFEFRQISVDEFHENRQKGLTYLEKLQAELKEVQSLVAGIQSLEVLKEEWEEGLRAKTRLTQSKEQPSPSPIVPDTPLDLTTINSKIKGEDLPF